MESYSGLIFTICYSMTGDYFEAEDLAQDTFISAFRNLESGRHLSSETLMKLKTGKLSLEEKLEALKHIADCNLCRELLADSFQQEDLLIVPQDFQSRVVRETQAERTIVNSRISHKAVADINAPGFSGSNRRKREFYLYAARVSLAMCLTLMLVFSGTFGFMTSALEAKASQTLDLSKINSFTENIRNVSDKIVNMEVNNDDQKKK